MINKMDDCRKVLNMTSEGDKPNYLLVQEAIQRNLNFIQFQEDVKTMISKRASVELSYVKELQEWIDRHSERLNNANLYDECIRKVFTKALDEATSLATLHQKQYNIIMEDKGPFVQLLKVNSPGRSDGSNETITRDFETLERQYRGIQHKVTCLEEKLLRREELYRKSSGVLREIEKQMQEDNLCIELSPRSSRRQEKLRSKTPLVKARADEAYIKYKRSVDDLENYNSRQKETVKKMASELQQLEVRRVEHILEQMKEYSLRLETTEEDINRRAHKLVLYDLENIVDQIDVEHVLKNAFRRSNSEISSRHSNRINKLKSSVRCSSREIRNVHHTRISSNRPTQDSDEMKSRDSNHMQLLDKMAPGIAGETCRNFHEQKACRTPSDVSAYPKKENRRVIDVKPAFKNRERREAEPICEYLPKSNGDGCLSVSRTPSNSSDSAIEEIEMSSDACLGRGQNPPFPAARAFCAGSRGFSIDGVVGPNETDKLPDTLHPMLLHSNDTDVEQLRDVKVVALSDNQPTNAEHLQLRKGQVVMQIAGKNEDGLSYGWTKTRGEASKAYGFYPSNIVCLYQGS